MREGGLYCYHLSFAAVVEESVLLLTCCLNLNKKYILSDYQTTDNQGKDQGSDNRNIDVFNNIKYAQFCRSRSSRLHTQTNVSGLPIMQVLNSYKTKEI